MLIKCAICHIYRTDLESRVCYLKRNTRSIINNLGLEDMVSRKPGNRPNRRWSTGNKTKTMAQHTVRMPGLYPHQRGSNSLLLHHFRGILLECNVIHKSHQNNQHLSNDLWPGMKSLTDMKQNHYF